MNRTSFFSEGRPQAAATAAACTLALLFFTSALPAAEKWERVSNEQGIVVERILVSGSPVLKFRGSGVVNASVVEILALLQDINSQQRWNKNTYENRIVQKLSDREFVVYNAARTPWPFKDRDYLMRLRLQVDEKNRVVYVHGRETTHAKVPEHPDRVRVKLIRTTWIFKPLPNGKVPRTWVRFSMHADPGGSMPNWLINFISKLIPRKTIANLRREVSKGGLDAAFLKRYARFRTWY